MPKKIKLDNYDEIKLPDGSKIIVCTIPTQHNVKQTAVIDESIGVGYRTEEKDAKSAYEDFSDLGKIIRHAIQATKKYERSRSLKDIVLERLLRGNK